jgi:hypothetical protein
MIFPYCHRRRIVMLVLFMGSSSDSRSGGKDSVLREIDGVTRALKVAMLQMEGAVDLIRNELRATKTQGGFRQDQVETSWNPVLGAEIVVDEPEEGELAEPPMGTPTKKVPLLDILDRVPSQDRSDAGFTSQVFHDLLVQLEAELGELSRKIESATTWIRHLKEQTDTGFVIQLGDE